MLIVKLLSVIVILCVVILIVQLLQLCTLSKSSDTVLETFTDDDDANAQPISIDKKNIEKVTKDLDDIELSTNNMLLKIKSLKTRMAAKKETDIPFKDYVKKQMEKLKGIQEEEKLQADEEEEDEEDEEETDEEEEGDIVEGFMDGLSHNCSAY